MNSRAKKLTAVLVTGALLTGFGVSQVAQRLSFKDIPAGHWATTAVEYVAASGLITGFQNGTFRGQQNMTRYEAATIFYRLLKSGALKNVDEEGRALIAKGIGEVKVELDRVRGGFTELERSDASQTSRLGALEAQLRNLSVAPATNTNAQQVDAMRVLEARLKTLEDRSNVADAHEGRITILEDRIKALGAVESRVNGLEAQVDAIGKRLGDTNSDFNLRLQTVETQTKSGASQMQSVNSRLTALEGRVNALGERINAPAPPPPPPAPSTSSAPVTVEAPESAGFYLGGGASYPLAPMPMFDLTRSSYSTMIGVSRVLDLGFTNLGARVTVDYMPVGNTFTVNPALTFSAGGFFDPYLGLGVGFTLGGGDGVFVNAIAGFDVNLLGFAALFAELDPRYSFSTGQFGLNTRVGFKIKF
jgi:S-layer homology domain